jgi:hypothetical protein
MCLAEKLEWHGSSRNKSWESEVLNGLGEYLYNLFWSFFPACKVDAKGSDETQCFRMWPIGWQFQQLTFHMLVERTKPTPRFRFTQIKQAVLPQISLKALQQEESSS